eukprot:3597517-Pyramimonas_sp.AAC.1
MMGRECVGRGWKATSHATHENKQWHLSDARTCAQRFAQLREPLLRGSRIRQRTITLSYLMKMSWRIPNL